jgi:crossover junction endodeoxyribonuclease RuvC
MQHHPHTILGIDPGTRITGYGFIQFQNQCYTALDFGCIRPPATAPLPTRYHILFTSIEALLQKHPTTAIAIETQFVNKNPQSTIKLAMARAVVLILSAKYGIPIFEYSPTKAKKAVCGYGSAEKIEVQKMIQRLLKLPVLPEPEDAADALALAICHSNTLAARQPFQLLT